MQKIKVVTEFIDLDGLVRNEYAGILIGPQHAFYVDLMYSLVVLERVHAAGNNEYITTGGPGSVMFDLPVNDVSFIENIRNMSAIELLKVLILAKEEQ